MTEYLGKYLSFYLSAADVDKHFVCNFSRGELQAEYVSVLVPVIVN